MKEYIINISNFEHDGMYTINSEGKIFSFKTGKKKEIKPQIDDCGYERVTLYDRYGLKHRLRIHRVLLETYTKSLDEVKLKDLEFSLFVVDHIDNNTRNNNINNLRWTTSRKNTSTDYRKKFNPRVTMEKVRMDNMIYDYIIEKKSLSYIRKKYKVDSKNVTSLILGLKYNKYIFTWCENNGKDLLTVLKESNLKNRKLFEDCKNTKEYKYKLDKYLYEEDKLSLESYDAVTVEKMLEDFYINKKGITEISRQYKKNIRGVRKLLSGKSHKLEVENWLNKNAYRIKEEIFQKL